MNHCPTQDSPVCDMRLNLSCFFFFCRPSHRRGTHPVCLTRLPFLSFQHYIWPSRMRCIIVSIKVIAESRMADDYDNNGSRSEWKFQFESVLLSRKRAFLYLISAVFFRREEKRSVWLPALPVAPCCLCFWLIPRLKNTRDLFKHNISTVHLPKNRKITEF